MASQQWRTIWQCACGASGIVRHAEDAGVYEVVELIRGGHDRFAATTHCERGLSRVRIASTGPESGATLPTRRPNDA